MAKIPREKLNQIWRWLAMVEDWSALDIPMDDNNDTFDFWADWWLDAKDPCIEHDRHLQDLVNAGELDDLDAEWCLGNLEEWKPELERIAATVRNFVSYYEKYVETSEPQLGELFIEDLF